MICACLLINLDLCQLTFRSVYNPKTTKCFLFQSLQYLSQCVVGASLDEEEMEEEEEEASGDEGTQPMTKEGTYEIIATLKDRKVPKPEWVKEIIDVS